MKSQGSQGQRFQVISILVGGDRNMTFIFIPLDFSYFSGGQAYHQPVIFLYSQLFPKHLICQSHQSIRDPFLVGIIVGKQHQIQVVIYYCIYIYMYTIIYVYIIVYIYIHNCIYIYIQINIQYDIHVCHFIVWGHYTISWS